MQLESALTPSLRWPELYINPWAATYCASTDNFLEKAQQ